MHAQQEYDPNSGFCWCLSCFPDGGDCRPPFLRFEARGDQLESRRLCVSSCTSPRCRSPTSPSAESSSPMVSCILTYFCSSPRGSVGIRPVSSWPGVRNGPHSKYVVGRKVQQGLTTFMYTLHQEPSLWSWSWR